MLITDSICQRREAEPAAQIPRGVIFPVVLVNMGDYSDVAIARIRVLFDGIRSSEISYIFGGLQLRWGTCVIKTSDFQDSYFKACVTPKKKPTNRTYVFRDENISYLENHARQSHGYR